MLNIIVHFSRIEKSVDAENFCQGIRVEIKTKIKKKKKDTSVLGGKWLQKQAYSCFIWFVIFLWSN